MTSFPIPPVAVDAAPVACMTVNLHWASAVIWALDKLLWVWEGDDNAVFAAQQAIEELINQVAVECTAPLTVGSTLPPDAAPGAGWLRANGQALLKSAYPALYAVVGNLYDISSTEFSIPILVFGDVDDNDFCWMKAV